jgi:hypothetical protein
MSKLTIVDLSDALLEARETVKQWQDEFEREFHAPMLKIMVATMWQSMDEQTKNWYRANLPEQAREMDKLFGGSSKGQGG